MNAAPRSSDPQLTPSVEDYLKSVFHLTNQGGFATTSDIAEMLEVAPPSVSGMMKRLSETGLIEHVPYRGVQLTPQGRRAALQMIRRHRILESYLTSKLGYDWGDVHVEAEQLEHAVSEKLIGRMAAALPRRAGADAGRASDGDRPAAVQWSDDRPPGRRDHPRRGSGAGVAAPLQVCRWRIARSTRVGARFGYTLLTVILLSNLMAILLQGLAAKLGIVSGRDLAQACRDHYSRPVSFFLWIICEIAIAACDLAEVIGSVIVLIATIAGCFLFEILISKPDAGAVLAGFIPSASILKDPDKLYIAIGILGATVMPHNLYLHSSVVQTRSYDETPAGKREAVKFAFIDSTVALSFALFINAAILIVAAATFHRAGETGVAEIQDAYRLLTPLLGVTGASAVFAFALLASGQNSTLTGTLAGQIVMEGFLSIRIRPWLRRLITRSIAIVPAALMAIFFGERGAAQLLILSQVILSLQLSLAVFPLVRFTSDRLKMGEFVNPTWLKVMAYTVAGFIATLNAWLLVQTFKGWIG